jgi:hypothetical protein
VGKKPLIIVSICAVVLLVMASLSNVVGYQSVKSTTVSDSPLFQTRTQRATNQQQNTLTSQYLGKGKEHLLQFPVRDTQTESLIKAIEFISRMDDKTFERCIELFLQQTTHDTALSDTSRNEITQALQLLRTKTILFFNSSISKNNNTMEPTAACPTWAIWFPGCLLLFLFLDIIIVEIPFLVATTLKFVLIFIYFVIYAFAVAFYFVSNWLCHP